MLPRRVPFAPVLLAALLLSCFTGCSPNAALSKLADDEVEQAAHAVIDQLRTGDFDAIAEVIHPELRTAQLPIELTRMRLMFPEQEETSRELLNYRFFHSTNEPSTYQLLYICHYPDHDVQVRLAFQRLDDDRLQLNQFYVDVPKSGRHPGYGFPLSNRTPLHYLVLALAVALPAFNLVTLIVCFRTRMPKHKLWWILFILIGLTQFTFVWNSGAWGWAPLHIHLPCVAAGYVPEHASWVLQLSVPVGALLFWVRRQEWTAPPSPPAVPDDPADPA